MEQPSQVLNIILGIFSLLAIISGFLIKEYQIPFWLFGCALLIFIVIGHYALDNRNRLNLLSNKFRKIEESLNIYNRLNKLELAIDGKMKRGQINLIDIIKVGLAIILIIVFVKAIGTLLGG